MGNVFPRMLRNYLCVSDCKFADPADVKLPGRDVCCACDGTGLLLTELCPLCDGDAFWCTADEHEPMQADAFVVHVQQSEHQKCPRCWQYVVVPMGVRSVSSLVQWESEMYSNTSLSS